MAANEAGNDVGRRIRDGATQSRDAMDELIALAVKANRQRPGTVAGGIVLALKAARRYANRAAADSRAARAASGGAAMMGQAQEQKGEPI